MARGARQVRNGPRRCAMGRKGRERNGAPSRMARVLGSNEVRQSHTRRLDRRSAGSVIAVVSTALLIAACGGGDGPVGVELPETPTSATTAPPPAAVATETVATSTVPTTRPSVAETAPPSEEASGETTTNGVADTTTTTAGEETAETATASTTSETAQVRPSATSRGGYRDQRGSDRDRRSRTPLRPRDIGRNRNRDQPRPRPPRRPDHHRHYRSHR